jgi:hypothetical protein
MLIADPDNADIRIDLPVEDAIVLHQGAPAELFLDTDPLRPLAARLVHASYQAEVTPSGILAYRVKATFDNERRPPRIGLHGTAKIEGEKIPLALYLFRRPIAVLRQTLGL